MRKTSAYSSDLESWSLRPTGGSNCDSEWVEHRLAYVAQREGRRARYSGTRANLFDLRRCCAIQNLEITQAVAPAQAA